MALFIPEWSNVFPQHLITDLHRGMLPGNITAAALVSNKAVQRLAPGDVAAFLSKDVVQGLGLTDAAQGDRPPERGQAEQASSTGPCSAPCQVGGSTDACKTLKRKRRVLSPRPRRHCNRHSNSSSTPTPHPIISWQCRQWCVTGCLAPSWSLGSPPSCRPTSRSCPR